jgi:hypothetical protein
MTTPDPAGRVLGHRPRERYRTPAPAPAGDQLQQHPDGCWPAGWVCLDEDGQVVVWDADSWRVLPPPAGVDPGLWEVLAWKLGRDGELP